MNTFYTIGAGGLSAQNGVARPLEPAKTPRTRTPPPYNALVLIAAIGS